MKNVSGIKKVIFYLIIFLVGLLVSAYLTLGLTWFWYRSYEDISKKLEKSQVNFIRCMRQSQHDAKIYFRKSEDLDEEFNNCLETCGEYYRSQKALRGNGSLGDDPIAE